MPDEPTTTAGRERSRRDLVRAGGALAIALGSAPFLLAIRSAFAGTGGDRAILRAAIELEQRAALAYDAISRSRRLDSGMVRSMALFRDQEEQHADSLTQALRRVGGRAPAKPESARAVPGLAAAVAADQDAIARFALGLETMTVRAYYDAHGKLREERHLRLVTSIMGNEGQHLAILREALGRDPLPTAFETGGG